MTLCSLPQISILIGGVALYLAYRGGGGSEATAATVLLNLGRWLVITAAFTFVYALYKVRWGRLEKHFTQEWSYLLGERFSACIVLKFAFQNGEGEKGRECKFQNKAEPLTQEITPPL